MASNHTEKLGLSIWNSNDSVLMSDFNSDNSKIEAAYRQLPRIAFGSYVGSGTFGPDHPNSISCTMHPYLVVIAADDSINFNPLGIFLLNQEQSPGLRYADSSGDMANLRIEWTGYGVKWYSAGDTGSARKQLNEENVMYRYVIVGFP